MIVHYVVNNHSCENAVGVNGRIVVLGFICIKAALKVHFNSLPNFFFKKIIVTILNVK